MKKLFIGVAGLVVLLVAAALIVPSFINWNEYKDEIATEVAKRTGRTLVIGGDIGLTLLPAPAVVAKDLRLGNIEGAEAEDMVWLRSLEVRVAFGPLLQGHIQVRKVRLVEPVVHLEALADGRKNWEFAERVKGSGPASSMKAIALSETAEPAPPGAGDKIPGEGGDPSLPVSVQFDSLEIENGLVVYRDEAAGTVERVEDLTATVAANSLRGPFEGQGELTARGLRTGFRIALGRIDGDQPVPVSLLLTPEAGKTRFELRGMASGIAASPRFTGSLDAKADNLAGLIQAIDGGGGGLPGFLSQSLDLAGDVTASASRVDVSGLSLHLGKTGATGGISARLDGEPAVSAQLAIAHLNLDSWLELAAPSQNTASSGDNPGKRSNDAPPSPSQASAPAGGGFRLPAGLGVSLAVSAEAITYRDGIIRDARVNAELAEGEITVSQISGDLPGATELAAFGFVTVPEGNPRFEGEMDLKAGDVRGLLRWLGVNTGGIAPGRVRTVDLKGKLTAMPGAARLHGMDLRFDASHVTGRMSVERAERLVLDADLAIDRIDVDAYLPRGGSGKTAVKTDGNSSDQPAMSPPNSAPGSKGKSGLEALGAFDAKVKARVGRLTYRGTPFKTVVLDATLLDGVVDVSEASVGQVAGASGRLAGVIEPLAQTPGAKRLGFEFDVPSLDRLLRALNLPRPDPVTAVDPFALTGTMDGPFVKPAVDLNLHAAGGETTFRGVLEIFPKPAFSGRVKLTHVDIVQLLGSLGVSYRPSGRIGVIDLAGRLDAHASRVDLTEIDGAIGDTSLGGSVNADLAGERPTVVADLKTGRFVVDPYLPAKRTARATPRLIPASWSMTPEPRRRREARIHMAANAPHQRWSRTPLDLSFMRAVDADLTLKAQGIAHGRYELEDVDAVAKLAAGVLTAEPLTGLLFRGPARAKVRFDANGTPRLDGEMTVKNADLARASRDGKGRPAATGRMAFTAKVTSQGLGAADLVSGLDGSGSVRLTEVEAGDGAAGGGTASVINLLQQLNGIGARLGESGGRAQVTATFRIEDGIVRSDDIALVSGLGDGDARGLVDLPRWRTNVGGKIHLRGNIITGLMIETEGPPIVPFRIQGPVDNPNVQVDASSLKVRRVVIPDLKNLDGKKGLDAILGILK